MKHPKGFKALQSEWYAKLKATGYDDIEYHDGSLKRSINLDTNKAKESENLIEFYSIACEYLTNGKFDIPEEKKIWALFCEGRSLQKIRKEVKAFRKKKTGQCSIDTLREVIDKYKERAGLKS